MTPKICARFVALFLLIGLTSCGGGGGGGLLTAVGSGGTGITAGTITIRIKVARFSRPRGAPPRDRLRPRAHSHQAVRVCEGRPLDRMRRSEQREDEVPCREIADLVNVGQSLPHLAPHLPEEGVHLSEVGFEKQLRARRVARPSEPGSHRTHLSGGAP